MIHYVFADGLDDHPALRDSMLRDRTRQFRDRLGWDLVVDWADREVDAYDGEAPLYVIATRPDGTHAGSLRFLPTMGRTMLHDHFSDLTNGVRIASPQIWECTRFCIAPLAPRRTAARLLLAAAELGLASGLSHAVGVFDAPMLRVYDRLGWRPAVLGRRGVGRAAICAGLWAFTEDVLPGLRGAAGVAAPQSQGWVIRAFGPRLAA